MNNIYNIIFTYIYQLIYPENCLGCGILLKNTTSICAKCNQELYFIQKPFCPILGLPMPRNALPNSVSFEALIEPPPFSRARSVFRHSGLVRKLIASLKYQDRLDLIPIFVNFLNIAGAELIKDCDIIVPIPLHYKRFFFRHYNQSSELAKLLAKRTNKKFEPIILKRIKNTKPQTSLVKKDRLINMKKVFICNSKKLSIVKNKNILLIDDVYTTGSTIKAACKALKKAKVRNIDVLTISNSYKYKI